MVRIAPSLPFPLFADSGGFNNCQAAASDICTVQDAGAKQRPEAAVCTESVDALAVCGLQANMDKQLHTEDVSV